MGSIYSFMKTILKCSMAFIPLKRKRQWVCMVISRGQWPCLKLSLGFKIVLVFSHTEFMDLLVWGGIIRNKGFKTQEISGEHKSENNPQKLPPDDYHQVSK